MRSIQAAGALVMLAPLPAAAQMIQAPGSPAKGPYTGATSGMTFPVTAGEFKRFRVLRGGGPQDINAGYIYITPEVRMVATVFVERTPPGPTGFAVLLGEDVGEAWREGVIVEPAVQQSEGQHHCVIASGLAEGRQHVIIAGQEIGRLKPR